MIVRDVRSATRRCRTPGVLATRTSQTILRRDHGAGQAPGGPASRSRCLDRRVRGPISRVRRGGRACGQRSSAVARVTVRLRPRGPPRGRCRQCAARGHGGGRRRTRRPCPPPGPAGRCAPTNVPSPVHHGRVDQRRPAARLDDPDVAESALRRRLGAGRRPAAATSRACRDGLEPDQAAQPASSSSARVTSPARTAASAGDEPFLGAAAAHDVQAAPGRRS